MNTLPAEIVSEIVAVVAAKLPLHGAIKDLLAFSAAGKYYHEFIKAQYGDLIGWLKRNKTIINVLEGHSYAITQYSHTITSRYTFALGTGKDHWFTYHTSTIPRLLTLHYTIHGCTSKIINSYIDNRTSIKPHSGVNIRYCKHIMDRCEHCRMLQSRTHGIFSSPPNMRSIGVVL